MSRARLALATAALALAFGPLAPAANAVVCEFPLSVYCAVHGTACQYVPEQVAKIRTHDLLCTVAA